LDSLSNQNVLARLIVLSAKDEERLKAYAEKMLKFLTASPPKSIIPQTSTILANIAYTLQVGREAMEERLAIVTGDMKELCHALDSFVKGNTPIKDLYRGNVSQKKDALKGRPAEEVIKKAFTDGQLNQLSQLWVSGVEIDWKSFYQDSSSNFGNTPRRISLPTYPFARERYWIASAPLETSCSDGSIVPLTSRHIKKSETPPVESPVEYPQDSEKEFRKLYYRTQWAPLEIDKTEQKKSVSGHVLLFDMNDHICREFKTRTDDGTRVLLVKPGDCYREYGDGVYKIDSSNIEDYIRLFNHLVEEGLSPVQLVHLWSMYLETGIHFIYVLANALFNVKHQSLERFYFLYHQNNHTSYPLMSAVAGCSNSLGNVLPNFSISFVQVFGERNQNVLKITTEEFFGQRNDKEVRYEKGKRYVNQIQPVSLQSSTDVPMRQQGIRQQGVYLITGGMGGLGFIFARYLAEKYQARLVLIGRSPLNPQKQKKLDEISRLGGDVSYYQADVAIYDDMSDVIEKIKAFYGELNGIFHAAGVTDDRGIIQKDLSAFEATLKPKIQGTMVLDELTANEPMDFFLLFSSTSSILGDFGQCDYSIANRFLDDFVPVRETLRSENKRTGRTFSINWPLWREGGMHGDAETESLYLKTSGMTYLETQVGLKSFEEILHGDQSRVIVLVGDQTRIDQFLHISPAPEPNRKNTRIEENEKVVSEKIVRLSKESLLHRTIIDIQKIAADILMIDAQRLDPEVNLGNFGFDSISLKIFSKHLNDTYQIEITPMVFYSKSNIKTLSLHLLENHPRQMEDYYTPVLPVVKEITHIVKNTDWIGESWQTNADEIQRQPAAIQEKESVEIQERTTVKEPIAIIGMSGIFPGSKNLDEYWNNLYSGKDLIIETPEDRWNWRDFSEDSSTAEYLKMGGFISDVDKFDPLFFSISPREAESMDPQHRLFLETAWKAIEDAGYKASDLSGNHVGIFAGVQFNDYQQLLCASEFNSQAGTGTEQSMLVNRVSFLLNFRGPSESINTACSGSLVSIHRAVRAIRGGECEMALAGGVSLILSPYNVLGAVKLGVLSPDGQCKTFDKNANGYVKGEGVGVLMLKPLRSAEKDQDHIYGVIHGTAENHGGRANSLTSPNSDAQAELLVTSYEDSGFDPKSITYLELHGTGTELGDPVEIEGIKKAFGELSKKRRQSLHHSYCGIGSVKTNIGHLESASGIAGVIKVLLAMKHGKLPATLHVKQINPYIQLKDTPFYIVDKSMAWKRVQDFRGRTFPRRAGVSSFGFGGANAHVVLEEYPASAPNYPNSVHENHDHQGHGRLIPLSAKNEDRLKAYAEEIVTFLEKNDPALANKTPVKIDEKAVRQRMQTEIMAFVSNILGVDVLELHRTNDLAEYGFDRIHLALLSDRINDKYLVEFDITDCTEKLTVEFIVNRLWDRHKTSISSDYVDAIGDLQSVLSLSKIAYTLQVGREAMPFRLAIIVSSLEELHAKLVSYGKNKADIENLYCDNIASHKVKSELLIEDEEGAEFVKRVIHNQKLSKLARLWVSGVEIDWSLLYPDGVPGRISLPTYPFERKRYWIPNAERTVYTPPIVHTPTDISAKKADFVYESDLSIKPEVGAAYIEKKIQANLAQVLQIDQKEIDLDIPFAELGVNSILSVEISKNLNHELKIDLKTTDLFNYSTIRKLAHHIFHTFSNGFQNRDHGSSTSSVLKEDSLSDSENERENADKEMDDAIMDLFKKLEVGVLDSAKVVQYLEDLNG